MKILSLIIRVGVHLALLLPIANVLAKPNAQTMAQSNARYQPHSPEQIIARWDTTAAQVTNTARVMNADSISQLANAYLSKASQPGYSHLYGVAEAALKPQVESGSNHLPTLLAWVQVQQHQHRFVLAQQTLSLILQQDAAQPTALLLKARLHLIQGELSAAKKTCMALLGKVDLLTLGACSLEVRSSESEQALRESYAQLQQLIASQGLPTDERNLWLLQMLADMALRLNQPDRALQHLQQVSNKNSLSYWVQLADINLALGDSPAVIQQLTPLINNAPQQDDALLLRLVIAEKNLLQDSPIHEQLAQRMQLRIARDDQAHAADVALYFLQVEPDAQQALYWAERNWQLAREASDKLLLERAQQAVALNLTHLQQEG
jgi:hypothetical protein